MAGRDRSDAHPRTESFEDFAFAFDLAFVRNAFEVKALRFFLSSCAANLASKASFAALAAENRESGRWVEDDGSSLDNLEELEDPFDSDGNGSASSLLSSGSDRFSDLASLISDSSSASCIAFCIRWRSLWVSGDNSRSWLPDDSSLSSLSPGMNAALAFLDALVELEAEGTFRILSAAAALLDSSRDLFDAFLLEAALKNDTVSVQLMSATEYDSLDYKISFTHSARKS